MKCERTPSVEASTEVNLSWHVSGNGYQKPYCGRNDIHNKRQLVPVKIQRDTFSLSLSLLSKGGSTHCSTTRKQIQTNFKDCNPSQGLVKGGSANSRSRRQESRFRWTSKFGIPSPNVAKALLVACVNTGLFYADDLCFWDGMKQATYHVFNNFMASFFLLNEDPSAFSRTKSAQTYC